MTLSGGKWTVSANNWAYAVTSTCITNDTSWTISGHQLTEVNSSSMNGPTAMQLVAAGSATIGAVTVPTYTKP